MSQVEIPHDISVPTEQLTGAKKVAVLIGVAAVMGFAVGWVLSMMTDQWGNGEVSVLCLCVGALVGGIIGRLGMKEAK